MELFPARCLLPSQAVPAALSDSFPSSIWLTGAGETEQGTAFPPHVPPPQSPAQDTQMLPTAQQEGGNEMRPFLDQPRAQTSQRHPSHLILDILAKDGQDMTFLEFLLCAKHCVSILSCHSQSESAECGFGRQFTQRGHQVGIPLHLSFLT